MQSFALAETECSHVVASAWDCAFMEMTMRASVCLYVSLCRSFCLAVSLSHYLPVSLLTLRLPGSASLPLCLSISLSLCLCVSCRAL